MGKSNKAGMDEIGATGKEQKMSEERRESEIARREKAQAHAGEVVSGSGKRGKPRRMAQMVSVRLDGELVSTLRTIAEQRGVTVSDLLREGAEQVVQDTYVAARPRISYTVVGADEAIPTAADHKQYVVN
jgi:predicted DNA-binding ribbon-helix-helix protein